MYEFVAVVRLPNGLTQRVAVRADDSGKGRAMLEAQEGRGCVLTLTGRRRGSRPQPAVIRVVARDEVASPPVQL